MRKHTGWVSVESTEKCTYRNKEEENHSPSQTYSHSLDPKRWCSFECFQLLQHTHLLFLPAKRFQQLWSPPPPCHNFHVMMHQYCFNRWQFGIIDRPVKHLDTSTTEPRCCVKSRKWSYRNMSGLSSKNSSLDDEYGATYPVNIFHQEWCLLKYVN